MDTRSRTDESRTPAWRQEGAVKAFLLAMGVILAAVLMSCLPGRAWAEVDLLEGGAATDAEAVEGYAEMSVHPYEDNDTSGNIEAPAIMSNAEELATEEQPERDDVGKLFVAEADSAENGSSGLMAAVIPETEDENTMLNGDARTRVEIAHDGTASDKLATEAELDKAAKDKAAAEKAAKEKAAAEKAAKEKAAREAAAKKARELANAKSKAKTYISDNMSKYKDSISKARKAKLKTYKQKVTAAASINAVSKWKDKAKSVFKPVKKLHKQKAKLVKATARLYSKYKSTMDSYERSVMKSVKAKLKTAKSLKATKPQLAKRSLMVARAKMSRHVAAHGWSMDKIKYVETWAKRNNRFLRGTAMSGTGYHIAASAYAHDMDPRICAAIAKVESNCGQAPYGCRYNVWGWIWQPPSMSSWADGIEKWTSYFSRFWGGERYPINSMHGYGGYGPGYINAQMSKI